MLRFILTCLLSFSIWSHAIATPPPEKAFRVIANAPAQVSFVAAAIWVTYTTPDGIGHHLLGRHNAQNGRYMFPGGLVDSKDRSFLETAIRELKEETCLNLYDYPNTIIEYIGKTGRGPKPVAIFKAELGRLSAAEIAQINTTTKPHDDFVVAHFLSEKNFNLLNKTVEHAGNSVPIVWGNLNVIQTHHQSDHYIKALIAGITIEKAPFSSERYQIPAKALTAGTWYYINIASAHTSQLMFLNFALAGFEVKLTDPAKGAMADNNAFAFRYVGHNPDVDFIDLGLSNTSASTVQAYIKVNQSSI